MKNIVISVVIIGLLAALSAGQGFVESAEGYSGVEDSSSQEVPIGLECPEFYRKYKGAIDCNRRSFSDPTCGITRGSCDFAPFRFAMHGVII
jgi:hypothetical protein